MDLLQLKYFREIARDGSITKAAERLTISQPALSKTLRNLETELGLLLFDRVGRGIRLNADGQYFFEAVDRALNVLEEATQNLKSRGAMENRTVTLINLIPEYYTWFMDAFLAEAEGIPLREIFLESTMEDTLYNGGADAALSFHGSDRCDFINETLLEDELLLMLPPGHPGFGTDRVLPEQFSQEAIIAYYSDLGIPQAVRSVIKTPSYQVSDLMMVVRLVEQGYGVSVIPSYLWLQMQPKLKFLREKDRAPRVLPVHMNGFRHHIIITYSSVRPVSKNTRQFIRFARDYFSREQTRLAQFRHGGYRDK